MAASSRRDLVLVNRLRAEQSADLALSAGAPVRSTKRASFETIAPRVLLYVVIGFFALLFAMPLYVMLVNSLKPWVVSTGSKLTMEREAHPRRGSR